MISYQGWWLGSALLFGIFLGNFGLEGFEQSFFAERLKRTIR